MRLLFPALFALNVGTHAQAATVVTSPLATARQHAEQVVPMITAALWPAKVPRSPTLPLEQSLGAKLADYAANPAGNPQVCESLVEGARRVLAGGTPAKRTPDETIFALDELADKIFAAVDAAEIAARASRAAAPEREFAELRARAHLARFHARRIVAAMHYNLFKRGLRLAELVAATYAEKDAVVAWRELTTLPATPKIMAARRSELKHLEASLRELEEQCCPPDEAILKEKVWQPVRPARLGAN